MNAKANVRAPARTPRPAGKAAGKAPGRMTTRRADFGAPIDGFFARQPPHLAAILVELRKLVEAAAPEATATLKWGMPVYELGGVMMCALGGHKAHVNLILSGDAGAYADPERRLTGESSNGRHLRLETLDELPRAAVRGWLKTAAQLARVKAAGG